MGLTTTGLAMTDPRGAYSQQLEQRRAEIALREQGHRRLGHFRLAAVAAAAVIALLALGWQMLSIAWMLAPGVVFAMLMVVHDRVLKKLERQRRAAAFFEKALKRLDGQWAGTGETGDRYLTAEHPYAADLDLFGKGSLFELLCTTRTHIGEDTLARWLMAPAAPDVVRARNEAVNEVRPRLDLREDLAVLGEDARTGVDPISLAAWGEAPAAIANGSLRITMWLLTALGIIGAAALIIWLLAFSGVLRLAPRLDSAARDVALVI